MSNKEKGKPKVSPLERAWICGVFEAKATISKNNNTIPIDSYNEGMLNRLRDSFGRGKVTALRRTTGRPQYRFVTTSMDDTRELILFVMPLLTPFKAAQAAQVLKRIENNPNWRKKFPEKAASLVTAPVE